MAKKNLTLEEAIAKCGYKFVCLRRQYTSDCEVQWWADGVSTDKRSTFNSGGRTPTEAVNNLLEALTLFAYQPPKSNLEETVAY